MSLCAQCGHPTFRSENLCLYHSASCGDDWARGNRLMCDFLHRGIVSPPRTSDGRTAGDQAELLRMLARL